MRRPSGETCGSATHSRPNTSMGLSVGLDGSATPGTAADGRKNTVRHRAMALRPARRQTLLSSIRTPSVSAAPGDPAVALVLIHDPHRLHEGMANGRADEAETSLLECLAHGIALRRRLGKLAEMQRSPPQHLAVGKLPDVIIERAMALADSQIGARVADECIDL